MPSPRLSDRCARIALGLWIASAWLAGPGIAAPPLETASVATLPGEVGVHSVWVTDRILEHSILYDGDDGRVLGMIDSSATLTPKPPLHSPSRHEFYSVDLAYSRGLRGERIDFVSIYDSKTLAFVDEIMLPTATGQSNASLQYAEILAERFLAIFNQWPTVSVSIVDLEARRFVGEIPITGCAGIYPVSERRLATLCGNGTVVLVELEANGEKKRLVPSEPFFSVVDDPVAMAAGRSGTSWTFVSFAGIVRTVDFAGEAPAAGDPWSLTSATEQAEGWRPGGLQHVALHGGLGRLYVGMHRGEAGSHKSPGEEIWVFDLETHERVARFELPNLTASFLASFMKLDPESFSYRILDWVLPNAGVHAFVVSQDESPLLFARNAELGSIAVIDARSGETLRFLTEAGLTGPTMRVP